MTSKSLKTWLDIQWTFRKTAWSLSETTPSALWLTVRYQSATSALVRNSLLLPLKLVRTIQFRERFTFRTNYARSDSMTQPNLVINYAAIGVCVLWGMVFGFVWYGPLFGKLWARLMNFPTDFEPTP